MLGQINLRPVTSVNDTSAFITSVQAFFGDGSNTGRASMLYRSRAADHMWRSWLFTFSPSLKQTWEVMLQKQTSISYGVDGLPPGVSLDSRSEERSGLEFAGSFIRLGEIDSEEQITASFIIRSTDLELTNTYRYVMTVPGVVTTMGGTLTAVLYVTLAPLAVYCLWKKCRGGSVLDIENEPDEPVMDEAMNPMTDQALDSKPRHSGFEPEQGTRKADQI